MGRAGFEPATLGLKVLRRCHFRSHFVDSTTPPFWLVDRPRRPPMPALVSNLDMSHQMSHRRYSQPVAAPAKLTEADVKQIRRRIRRGEHQTELAAEFGVNRKTIRRRVCALDSAEREQAEQAERRRLHRQAQREKRKLLEHERAVGGSPAVGDLPRARALVRSERRRDPYHEWLDRRKNLSGRALSEANGFVRLARGGERRWVERSDVDSYFDAGWVPEDRVLRTAGARR